MTDTPQPAPQVCANCGQPHNEHKIISSTCPGGGSRWFPKSLADAISTPTQPEPELLREDEQFIAEPFLQYKWVAFMELLQSRLREARAEIADAHSVLAGAIDRAPGDIPADLHTISVIAANAIAWRDVEIAKIRAELEQPAPKDVEP